MNDHEEPMVPRRRMLHAELDAVRAVAIQSRLREIIADLTAHILERNPEDAARVDEIVGQDRPPGPGLEGYIHRMEAELRALTEEDAAAD